MIDKKSIASEPCGLKETFILYFVFRLSFIHHLLNGGGERDRTDDLLNANQALSQLSYTPVDILEEVVGQERLELSTSRLSSACSNQLSYWPKIEVLFGQEIGEEIRRQRFALALSRADNAKHSLERR